MTNTEFPEYDFRSEYNHRVSLCCGEMLSRPSGGQGPWFCANCGETFVITVDGRAAYDHD